MSTLSVSLADRLAELAARHDVVGASLAVHTPDGDAEAAYGVTSLATGVPVTTDTVFHIGSISKVYTATLVMQLAEQGRFDLDTPVTECLPWFALADPDATEQITIRQLLCHTSGIDGDIFTDFGRGDDAVAQYVAALAKVGLVSRPGELFSYCNAGYVVLGHLVATLTAGTWESAIRDQIAEPLGLADTVTLPEEAILRRAAVGHLTPGERSGPQPTGVWQLPRSIGPAGLITATARDVVRFAVAHIHPNPTGSADPVLQLDTARAMREPQVPVPDGNLLAAAWGLGWIRYRSAGGERPALIGHDGTTMGQQAYLRVVPEAGVAIALLTNGGGMGALARHLLTDLLRDLAGVTPCQPPGPPAAVADVDLATFTGRYERASVRYDLTLEDDGVRLETTALGELSDTLPAEPPRRLVPLDGNRLVTTTEDPRLGQHLMLTFIGDPASGFTHLHAGGRATPRVAA